MGSEASIHEKEGKLMATFSLATKDSYQDEQKNWKEKATIWHRVAVYNNNLVELVKSFKKGTRIEVNGSLAYKPFKHILDDGREVQKQEASIIAYLIQPKPLAKKTEHSTATPKEEMSNE